MPLNTQNDVANSGIRQGVPLRNAGITCSTMPNGYSMASREERGFMPPHISASGLNQRYYNRFDDYTYYSA